MVRSKARYAPDNLLRLTRSLELPAIKQARHSLLRSLIGRETVEGSSDYELTKAEFIVFSVFQHANLTYLSLFLNMSYRYGIMITCLVYCVFELIFGLPLYMLYLFLSSYTKKSFLTIWECVPIFEGVGYTVAMVKFLYEVNNVAIASYCVIMLKEVMSYRTGNMYEYFTGYEKNENNIPTLNCTNSTNRQVLVGTQYYFRILMLGYDRFSSECCTVNSKHIIIFICLWILIFLISILGIERIVKTSYKLMLTTLAVISCISFYVLVTAKQYSIPFPQPPLPFNKFNFWLELVHHTNPPASLAHTLWLGTLLPKNFSPRSAALVLAFTKTVICLALMCFSSIVIHGILHNYSFADPKCLMFIGVDIVISFVPDMLFRMHFGQLTALFWYLSLALITLLSPIFCVLAIVDSVCQSRIEFNSRRLIICLVCCLCGFLLSTPYALDVGFGLLTFFTRKGMLFLKSIFLLLVNISFIFLYSVTRIIEDYTFTYGSHPHAYWQFFWRMVPIFSLYLLIFMTYEIKLDSYLNNYYERYISISSFVAMAVIISPILIVAILKIFQQLKYRSLKYLLRPADTWGPYVLDKRLARDLFFPEREIKYRNRSLRCSHNCLADTFSYHREHARQMKMLHNYAVEHKDTDTSFIKFILDQNHL